MGTALHYQYEYLKIKYKLVTWYNLRVDLFVMIIPVVTTSFSSKVLVGAIHYESWYTSFVCSNDFRPQTIDKENRNLRVYDALPYSTADCW